MRWRGWSRCSLSLTAESVEWFEERVAIMQYDGGLTRDPASASTPEVASAGKASTPGELLAKQYHEVSIPGKGSHALRDP